MSSRNAGRGRGRHRRKVILIFGEDQNDTKSIRELLLALCPDLRVAVKPLTRPPILMRDAPPADVADRVARIAALIEAEQAVSDVLCVFAHEDCDSCEPAHDELSNRIESAFSSAGHHVHAVAPAWELESWWFLWPDAIAEYRPSWSSLHRYSGRDIGRIRNSKEEIRRALRPQGPRKVRDYRESDSPGIAQKVREMGLVEETRAQSGSYERFRASALECCAAAT